MQRRMIDFQGLVDLDPKVVDELSSYLQERETRLTQQILEVIHPTQIESFNPVLPLTGLHLKLSDAVEGFTKKVRSFVSGAINQMPNDKGQRVSKEVNKALWDYTEVLESSVIELFQQIQQVNVDRWHVSLDEVVHSLKDLLHHHLEELMWAIKRLEKPLKDYCQKSEQRTGLRAIFPVFHRYIDPNLLKNLTQSEDYLKKNYDSFQGRYQEFEKINAKVEKQLQKLKVYPVLALLDMPLQNSYVDVFRLLKMLELNPRPKGALAQETTRSLKNLASVDGVIHILDIYYKELEEGFFKSSLELKSMDKDPQVYQEQIERLKVKLSDYRQELKSLVETMGHYRNFMLKTDPNPYVSSRWGFSEWIVGPEPVKAKKLLSLIYQANDLSAAYGKFLQSLDRLPDEQQRIEVSAHQEIESLLHEIGQPLISRSMMHNRAEKLLEQIKACDEVGSPNKGTIKYIGEVLAKAMREDWKYHELHEFPLFHEVMRNHKGLSDRYVEPAHAFRMERFQELFIQIEQWVRKGDLYSHVHEVELDMNDMKAYLQDFLASLQRVEKEKGTLPFLNETVEKFGMQLLEYRYLFGQFFNLLMKKNSDSQQLRNQFLFVDQYFESIENLLNDLSSSWKI